MLSLSKSSDRNKYFYAKTAGHLFNRKILPYMDTVSCRYHVHYLSIVWRSTSILVFSTADTKTQLPLRFNLPALLSGHSIISFFTLHHPATGQKFLLRIYPVC